MQKQGEEQQIPKSQQQLLKMFPNKVQLKLKRSVNSKLKEIGEPIVMVTKNTTVGNILGMIRKKLELKQSQAIFIFAQKTILHFNDIIGDVLNKLKYKFSSPVVTLEYTEYSVFGF